MRLGSGKSSLINAIFGLELAAADVGAPVTQGFSLFEPEGKPFRIYDSKGAEMGARQALEFVAEVESFLEHISSVRSLVENVVA